MIHYHPYLYLVKSCGSYTIKKLHDFEHYFLTHVKKTIIPHLWLGTVLLLLSIHCCCQQFGRTFFLQELYISWDMDGGGTDVLMYAVLSLHMTHARFVHVSIFGRSGGPAPPAINSGGSKQPSTGTARHGFRPHVHPEP